MANVMAQTLEPVMPDGGLVAAVAELMLMSDGRWINTSELERVGSIAWRTRLSEARLAHGFETEHRVRRDGKMVTVSEYRLKGQPAGHLEEAPVVTEMVPIADLSGSQIRLHLDQTLIEQYAEAMKRGDTFPAVDAFRDHEGALFLSDGFHRKHAASAAGLTELKARIRPGGENEAIWFGIGANGKHGKRLNDKDIKHAIALALVRWPELSTPRIAEQVGCSHQFVQRTKEQVATSCNLTSAVDKPARVIGKDGKTYPAKHDKSRRAVANRVEQLRALAAKGSTVEQISAALNLGEQRVRDMSRQHQIVIQADGVMRRSRKINANRIIDKTVEAAAVLTAETMFINWKEVDVQRVSEWVKSLRDARTALTRFISRLQEATQ